MTTQTDAALTDTALADWPVNAIANHPELWEVYRRNDLLPDLDMVKAWLKSQTDHHWLRTEVKTDDWTLTQTVEVYKALDGSITSRTIANCDHAAAIWPPNPNPQEGEPTMN